MEIRLAENKYEKYLRRSCVIFGFLGILNSICSFLYMGFSFSASLPGLLGVILFFYGVFYYAIENACASGFGKFCIRLLKTGFLAWLVSFLAVCIMLAQNAAHTPMANADAVIILGAGLNGDQVSQTLAYRLDTAIEYYEENGQPVMVVSGGQGSNELVPEAEAMCAYLVAHGVNPNHIIQENQSHNTRQNFEYSKVLLDNHFAGQDYRIVYVTNQFHTFRAGLLAEKTGFTADGLGAPSTPYLLPNQYFREYFSLIKYALVDSW